MPILTAEWFEDNAAFADDPSERRLMFSAMVRQMETGRTEGKLLDSNGNEVGEWSIEGDDQD